MVCGGFGPALQTMQVVLEYIYPSSYQKQIWPCYAVYALSALSKATTELLNPHPDKLLRIVINAKMP